MKQSERRRRRSATSNVRVANCGGISSSWLRAVRVCVLPLSVSAANWEYFGIGNWPSWITPVTDTSSYGVFLRGT